ARWGGGTVGRRHGGAAARWGGGTVGRRHGGAAARWGGRRRWRLCGCIGGAAGLVRGGGGGGR
ncbi:hypothetical protein ACGFY5_33470, partial [Cryptosporangium sp. NPDC048952]